MNSTEPEGRTDGLSEGDGEIKDGDKSEEEKTVFTRGQRRSKRQVSVDASVPPTSVNNDSIKSILYSLSYFIRTIMQQIT